MGNCFTEFYGRDDINSQYVMRKQYKNKIKQMLTRRKQKI